MHKIKHVYKCLEDYGLMWFNIVAPGITCYFRYKSCFSRGLRFIFFRTPQAKTCPTWYQHAKFLCRTAKGFFCTFGHIIPINICLFCALGVHDILQEIRLVPDLTSLQFSTAKPDRQRWGKV